ncbi:MAG: peptidoglycan recognition family protein [Sphingomonas sp.]
MPNWKPIVGLSFEADGFETYCKSLAWVAWRPSFVVLHNTATPDLAQRPHGFNRQHIDNLVHYYRDQQGWSAGPHLFIDDRQIWVFTPLTTTGRHSPAWNSLSIGIEMLGNYESDAFDGGRGAAVAANAISAIASIDAALGLPAETLRLHKEDPETTHKTCPGRHVDKARVIAAVSARLLSHYASDHGPDMSHPD